MNVAEQQVSCPEHSVESEFSRSDNRVNAGSSSFVEPDRNSANVAAKGVNSAFGEGNELYGIHPFSGFTAFMD
jgi:hypothetical protein